MLKCVSQDSLKVFDAYFSCFVISEFFKAMAGFLGLKGSFCSLPSRKVSLLQALERSSLLFVFGDAWVCGCARIEPRASHLLENMLAWNYMPRPVFCSVTDRCLKSHVFSSGGVTFL